MTNLSELVEISDISATNVFSNEWSKQPLKHNLPSRTGQFSVGSRALKSLSAQGLERPAQPDEIAPAYVFLASEADSSYIAGDILPLIGGETTTG